MTEMRKETESCGDTEARSYGGTLGIVAWEKELWCESRVVIGFGGSLGSVWRWQRALRRAIFLRP